MNDKQAKQKTVSTQADEMLKRCLLNDFQHHFPLSPTPYQDMADRLGTSEAEVIETLQKLKLQGYISRVGAVFKANTIGASTLAAMAVPTEALQQVAEMINQYEEVNHNYEREHRYNLWFVVTAANEQALQAVLTDMQQRTGYAVLYLPMVQDYHIDLGFELKWA